MYFAAFEHGYKASLIEPCPIIQPSGGIEVNATKSVRSVVKPLSVSNPIANLSVPVE